MFQKKSVNSVIKRLTDIAADLEAVVGTEMKANEERDEKIAVLEVELRESANEINRARRIQSKVNEFVL